MRQLYAEDGIKSVRESKEMANCLFRARSFEKRDDHLIPIAWFTFIQIAVHNYAEKCKFHKHDKALATLQINLLEISVCVANHRDEISEYFSGESLWFSTVECMLKSFSEKLLNLWAEKQMKEICGYFELYVYCWLFCTLRKAFVNKTD